MTILITGAKGQLGQDLSPQLKAQQFDVVAVDLEDADFTSTEAVKGLVTQYKPKWIVNCAAYVQVDKAESDSTIAYKVNSDAVQALGEAAQQLGARMVHISTDYVFDGNRSRPYTETSHTHPQGVYGASKLAGELRLQQCHPQAIIIRTSWLYGCHGQNFVKSILRLSKQHSELNMVADQIGTPTWSHDLGQAILRSIQQDLDGGLYHFSNQGVTSWYDFTLAILEEARRLGFTPETQRINPIPTRDFPTPASRPHYSVLSKEKISEALNWSIPHWRESLTAMLLELKRNDESLFS